MKKQLFLMAILAGAICLTSCEKPVGPVGPVDPVDPKDTTKTDTVPVVGDVTITVFPHEVVLTAEEPTVRLAATLDPADPTATIVWSSSDEYVATVTSRGVVEAVGYGDCYIYASVGDAKDSCYVQVKTYLESVLFTSAILWDVDTTYAMDPKTGEYKVETITAGDGSEWNCYLAWATLYVFSDGLYINNSGYFDGTEQGTILEVEAPMYYGTKYLNPEQGGVQFSLGKWAVMERAEPTAHVGEPGYVEQEEYLTQMKAFIEEFNNEGGNYGQYLKAAGEAVKGCQLAVLEYDAEREGYVNSYIPDAICDDAYFSLGGAATFSQYMRMLDFSIVTFRPFEMDTVFGSSLVSGLNLGWNDETETIYLNDEEIHFADAITSQYGEIPTGEEAPAMKPAHMPIISENPALKASLEKQIKDNNIRVIRKK